mgnify:CR=1 FL=1
MEVPFAHVFYKNDKIINHQYIAHGFYAGDFYQVEKLMFIVDSLHAEIIFTNGRLSISCFYDESKFDFGRVKSNAKLAYKTCTDFKDGKYYHVHSLSFYANDYSTDLPGINNAIRDYDDLLFDDYGIKRNTDNAFISAMKDIYEIMSRAVYDFENMLINYVPTFARTAPPAKSFASSSTAKLGGLRISVYDDYHLSERKSGNHFSSRKSGNHIPETKKDIDFDFVHL